MNSFDKNIFINCPFDEEYNKDFLRPLLFTIQSCGFNPRIASERFDSSENRLSKIKGLIEDSKYSIHDLSRIKSSKENEYYRLNMPFEIGLDLGCKYYHQDTKYRSKQTLIIEKEPYSYQKALSDIAGFDVRCYRNDVVELITTIRNWLSDYSIGLLPSGSSIWDDYNEFQSKLYKKLKEKGFKEKDIDSSPIREYQVHINNWIR